MSPIEFFKMMYITDKSIRDRSGLDEIVDIGMSINKEVSKAMNEEAKKKIEDIMEKIEADAYISSSPHTGEPMSAIRLTDVYNILCKAFGVEAKDTRYKYYE